MCLHQASLEIYGWRTAARSLRDAGVNAAEMPERASTYCELLNMGRMGSYFERRKYELLFLYAEFEGQRSTNSLKWTEYDSDAAVSKQFPWGTVSKISERQIDTYFQKNFVF